MGKVRNIVVTERYVLTPQTREHSDRDARLPAKPCSVLPKILLVPLPTLLSPLGKVGILLS